MTDRTVFQSPEIQDIAAAYVKAYAEIKNVPTNRRVRVNTKRGTTYDFRYASLDLVFEQVREPLASHDLALLGGLGLDAEGVPVLCVKLIHASGQWFASECNIVVDEPGPQAFGSALSYLKRYSVTALLPIAPTEDDDANLAEGNDRQDITQAPQRLPGVMSGAQLQDEAWAEAWTHPTYAIQVRDGDYQQFVHGLCEGIKRAPTVGHLQKLWGDNEPVLTSPDLGKRLFNRANKAYAVREAELSSNEGKGDAAIQ